MRFYRPKHFTIQELVSKEVFEKYGDRALMFFDARMLWTIDMLREKYGKAFINDWAFGGSTQYRGLREPECAVGSEMSQHRFGRAFDLTFEDYSAVTIRSEMRTYPKTPEFQYITRCEDGVSWLHIDNANVSYAGIHFFRP